MMDNDNIANAEQVLSDGNRAQRINSSTAGNNNPKYRCSRGHAISCVVQNDFSWKHLVLQELCDGIWNFARARIVTVNDQCSQRHGFRKSLSCFGLIESWSSAESKRIKSTHLFA